MNYNSDEIINRKEYDLIKRGNSEEGLRKIEKVVRSL